MSMILVYALCLGLSLCLLFVGTLFGPLKRLLATRRRRNQLAMVPAPPSSQPQNRPFDPLEQSSWHKLFREHIRQLARYVHVPPDLDEAGMPEELHRHMQVLAMLQDLFRAGRLHRNSVSIQDLDQ